MLNRIAPALYLLLLVAAIPWYWPHDSQLIWFGMPAWVVVAIGVSFLASILTATLLARAEVASESVEDE
jgi:hypothetical protein